MDVWTGRSESIPCHCLVQKGCIFHLNLVRKIVKISRNMISMLYLYRKLTTCHLSKGGSMEELRKNLLVFKISILPILFTWSEGDEQEVNSIPHTYMKSPRKLKTWSLNSIDWILPQKAIIQFYQPCRTVLKLNVWKPPVRAEESITSTPYSLWLLL